MPARPADLSLLTAAARVLLAIAEDERASYVELARSAGLSERQVTRLIPELEAAGFVTATRPGRRNAYQVHFDAPIKESTHATVADLLGLLRSKP